MRFRLLPHCFQAVPGQAPSVLSGYASVGLSSPILHIQTGPVWPGPD